MEKIFAPDAEVPNCDIICVAIPALLTLNCDTLPTCKSISFAFAPLAVLVTFKRIDVGLPVVFHVCVAERTEPAREPEPASTISANVTLFVVEAVVPIPSVLFASL